jgi:hypothetical protein
MPVPNISRQPSSSTSGAFVDAEDIWRSAAPSIASSSRHSTVVIPPPFPPPRGVARLLSALRYKLSSMPHGRKEYRDHAVPSSLPIKSPATPRANLPHPRFRPPNDGASSSSSPSSISSGLRKAARYRRRGARPRQAPAVAHRSTTIPNSRDGSPAGSHRTPSPHPDRMSASRYVDRGTGTAPLYPPPASSDPYAAPFAVPPASMHVPTNPSASVGHHADDLSETHQAERFRVFSFNGELTYVDAGKPYEVCPHPRSPSNARLVTVLRASRSAGGHSAHTTRLPTPARRRRHSHPILPRMQPRRARARPGGRMARYHSADTLARPHLCPTSGSRGSCQGFGRCGRRSCRRRQCAHRFPASRASRSWALIGGGPDDRLNPYCQVISMTLTSALRNTHDSR